LFLIGIPLLIIPVAVYHMLALLMPSVKLTDTVATIHMLSGADWSISLSDILIMLALVCLFFEIFKATRAGNRSIVDHMLSMVLFVVILIEFILWAPFGTSTYAIFLVTSLVDVVGGFTISIRSARRDFSLERAEQA
jgi:uncharacterized membrane protein